MSQVWRLLAVAGAVGAAASVALAAPEKVPARPGTSARPTTTVVDTKPETTKVAPSKLDQRVKIEFPEKGHDHPGFPGQRGPGSDTCAGATAVSVPSVTALDTTTATPDPETAICAAPGAGTNGVWFSFTGTGGDVRVNTCTPARLFDTVLRVYSGSCGALTCVGANDDFCGLGSQVDVIGSTLGATYYVLVTGFSGAGTAELQLIDLGMPPPGPVNDLCTGALPMAVPGSTAGDTTSATVDAEAGVCAGAGLGSPSVWYSFTGTGSQVQINTCGSATWDTVLRAFSGSCGALVCEAYNDDSCASLQSSIMFPTTAGTTYYVCVSGFGTSSGAFTLNASNFVPPANDECAGAAALTCGTTVVADTLAATANPADPGFSCHVLGPGTQGFGTVWYNFTAGDTSARFVTCNINAFPADDSLLALYDACGGFEIGCNDDFCGFLSRMDVTGLTVGATYKLQVAAWSAGDQALYNVEVICPVPPIPPGDECPTALPLAVPGSVSGDTTAFNPDGGLPGCGVGDASNSVWYSVVGNGNVFEATLCNGTAYDSAIAVFTGDCGSLSCVANDDDFCAFIGPSRTVWGTVAGQTYYVVVRGWGSGDAGPYVLDVNDLGPPAPGDFCTTAFTASVPGQISGDSCVGYTPEALGCGVGDASNGVWYSIVGNGNLFRASTCGLVSWDSALTVMSGDCSGLTCVAANDDSCGLQSTVTWPTTAGQTYFLVVRGFGANCGAYTVDLTEILPPPNDECSGALALTCNSQAIVDNSGATNNPSDIYSCRVGGGAGSGSVFYTLTATADSVRLATCSSAAPADDSMIEIFDGSCGNLISVACQDDGCNGFLTRLDAFGLTVGTTYTIQFASWGAADQGVYTLDITCPAPPPCDANTPGATIENEPDCGIPTDTVNGGCNSTPAIFGAISCGETIVGTGAFDGFTRDTDWFQFTLDEETEVTYTVVSEFDALVGFLEVTTPSPTGDCSEFTGFVNPFGFTVDDCTPLSFTATLGPGVWTVFVGKGFTNTLNCGQTQGGEYAATLTFGGGCGGIDCNQNGIFDNVEIAGNPALDCYNPAIIANPNVIGGSDGALDACQCQGDFNRSSTVNSSDISALTTGWLAAVTNNNTNADINCSGATNSSDISAFLTIWLAQVQNVNPWDGCP